MILAQNFNYSSKMLSIFFAVTGLATAFAVVVVQPSIDRYGSADRLVHATEKQQIVTLPSALAGYKRLFSDLCLEEHCPALFHCTGGKDRTGWAAASMLTLLGVPDEVVMREYLLTNDQLLPASKPIFDRFESMGGDPELLMPVYGVRKEYLQAALDEMRQRFSTIEGYFTEGLGLDADLLRRLRATFVEPVN